MRIDGWTVLYMVLAGLFVWAGVAMGEGSAYIGALLWVCMGVLNEIFARYL